MASHAPRTCSPLYWLWGIGHAAARYGPAVERNRVHAGIVALVCDTGPLYAAMDRREHDHAVCAGLLVTRREPLVVPSPVIVELAWLAGARLGPNAIDTFFSDVPDGTVTVADLIRSDYVRVRDLCAQYSDMPLGFVDAAVLAIVERLNEDKLATLDHRHFSVVRPRHIPHLRLLPELSH